MHLQVALKIVHLLILIVVFINVLRKCKRKYSKPNTSGGGGQGQTPVSLSFTCSHDGDVTRSDQIAMGTTALVVNAAMAF